MTGKLWQWQLSIYPVVLYTNKEKDAPYSLQFKVIIANFVTQKARLVRLVLT